MEVQDLSDNWARFSLTKNELALLAIDKDTIYAVVSHELYPKYGMAGYFGALCDYVSMGIGRLLDDLEKQTPASEKGSFGMVIFNPTLPKFGRDTFKFSDWKKE